MADQVLSALDGPGVAGTSVRLVDLDIRPGVEKDMGPGDARPGVRAHLPAAGLLQGLDDVGFTIPPTAACTGTGMRPARVGRRPTG